VERRSGAVISRRTAAPVRLADPDTLIRVDLSNDHLTMGRLITRTPLDQRYRWMYRPRVTLSTVVAAAALRIAQSLRDTSTPAVLLDPFCGSGTIPLEAAGAPGVWRRIHASDIAPEAVAGTRANLAANGAAAAVAVRRADATDLRRYYRDHGINTIVCNPPFGVRLGRRLNFGAFYGALLAGAAAITGPGSVLVLMSSRRRGRLNAVINRQTDWELMSVHLIETGGVFPGIFALRRRPRR
jgi:putative N6-adenine-specific DNA methylase/tRNA (guanine6-N2)-methyltransferase